MKRIKEFSQILLALFFLTSCRTTIDNKNPIINSEGNINENNNSAKERMEIKFSCGEDGISKYLDDGWIILKEDAQEKICNKTRQNWRRENLFIRKTNLDHGFKIRLLGRSYF